MDRTRISVIIPVYNTERYLRRCLDSILRSDYQEYEIILVNDGSTDHSPRICRRYSEKYHHIKFIDREHKGVSAARNEGIRESKGEWIVFVDSDDRISPDFLSMVGKKDYQDQDLLIFDFMGRGKKLIRFRESSVRYYGKDSRTGLAKCLLNAEQLTKYGNMSLLSPWAKAYKRNLIEQYSVRFAADISICEDRLFNMEYILKIKSCAYIPRTVYYAQSRPDSAMRRPDPGYLENDLRYQRYLRHILVKNGIFPLVGKAYYNSVLSNMADVLIRGIFNPHSPQGRREKTQACRRMREDAVYERALRHNGRMGILPRRLLLWAFARRYYGVAELICVISHRILEKTGRL